MKLLQSAATALRRSRVNEHTALVLILLFAFALRAYRLGANAIWWDESLSLYRATRDFGAILANTIRIQNVVTTDTLPQLYFILLRPLVLLFGTSEFALRFLSLAANVATVPLLYILGRRWFSPAAGIIAALLGALSPFYVWYSQEARPYALLLFWSLLAMYALTRALGIGHGYTRIRADVCFFIRVDPRKSASLLWFFVYLLAAVASVYTFYYALFLFPVHVILIALFVWRQPQAWVWTLVPAIPLASTVFLIPQVRASMTENTTGGPLFVSFDVMLRDLLNTFSVGITADVTQMWWVDVVLLVLFIIGILFSRFTIRNSQVRTSNLQLPIANLAFFFVPILIIQALSYIRPLYQHSRYLIAISPAFYLGVAAGIVALAKRWKIIALSALGIFLIGAAFALNHLYFDPRYAKDDHRAWAENLRERVRPGDFLILNSPHTEELYRYYADDLLPMVTLPIIRLDHVESPAADLNVVREAYQKNARIWYLAMDVPFDDPQMRIEKLLNDNGVLLDQVNFAGTSTAIALSLFVPQFPLAQPQDIPHPLDIAFDGHLHLKGYATPSSIEPGKHSIAKIYWQLDEPVGEDYAVSLRLLDANGARVEQWDSIPLGNRAGTSTWQPGKIIAADHDVQISANTPPGSYQLQVVPYHSATGTALGDVVALGNIQITSKTGTP